VEKPDLKLRWFEQLSEPLQLKSSSGEVVVQWCGVVGQGVLPAGTTLPSDVMRRVREAVRQSAVAAAEARQHTRPASTSSTGGQRRTTQQAAADVPSHRHSRVATLHAWLAVVINELQYTTDSDCLQSCRCGACAAAKLALRTTDRVGRVGDRVLVRVT